MKIEYRTDKTYHICLQDYKIELKNLGVPIEKFRESQLMEWFDYHLKRIENNDWLPKSRICRGRSR